jgi:hypothetical protein
MAAEDRGERGGAGPAVRRDPGEPPWADGEVSGFVPGGFGPQSGFHPVGDRPAEPDLGPLRPLPHAHLHHLTLSSVVVGVVGHSYEAVTP